MKKTALIVIMFLVIGLGVTIYLMYTHEPPDQVSRDPDYTMSTANLIAAFEKDASKAATMYVDKIIQCKGTIKSLDTSGSIVLTTSGSTGEIIVAVDPRYTPALKQATMGEEVTIQGVCSGYTHDAPSEDDLLAGLGATVRFRSAGIKE